MLPELEHLTKAKFKPRKAKKAARAPDHFYPDANFTDIVPKEMEQNKPDALILQIESVTLTNLTTDVHEEFAKQQVKVAASNMFSVATSSLAANPNLQRSVLMEAVPRFDTKAKQELNRYGNLMLHQAKQESNSIHKDQVYIGVHTLDCQGKGLFVSRYGDRRHQADMIHMRGPSGQAAYTRKCGQYPSRSRTGQSTGGGSSGQAWTGGQACPDEEDCWPDLPNPGEEGEDRPQQTAAAQCV